MSFGTHFARLSVIVPRNDLESETIFSISKKLGIDTRESKQRWGARLENETESTFRDLRENVIIIEIPGREKEMELERLGHNVIPIDHHEYHNLDRSSPKSSLEQFAQLVDYSLERNEQLVSINDQDYIWGLISFGASYDEITRIRDEDLKCQGITEADLKQARIDYSKGKKSWYAVIVETESPKLSSVIAEIHQKPSRENIPVIRQKMEDGKFSPPGIIVSVKSQNRINQINALGSSKLVNTVNSFIKQYFPDNHRTWLKLTDIGGLCGVMGAKNNREFHQKAENLLEKIDQLKTGKFSSFFLFPFTLDKDDVKCLFPDDRLKWEKKTVDVDENWPEIIYFHSFIREIIYRLPGDEKNSKSLFEYWTSGIDADKPGELEILYHTSPQKKENEEKEPDGSYKVKVTDLTIYKFVEEACIKDIFILCMQVEYTDSKPLMVNDIFRINEFIRQLYACYLDQPLEGKLAHSIKFTADGFHADHKFQNKPSMNGTKPEINQVIWKIIQSFLSHHNKAIRPVLLYKGKKKIENTVETILDNRMIVSTYVAFEKPDIPSNGMKEFMEKYKPVFSRLMYIDPAGDGYNYNPEFVEELLEEHTYNRWEHYGTMFGFTRYSFISTGFMDDYFDKEIFHHFETMYLKMFLLVLFYRSWLICFTSAIPVITTEILDSPEKRKQFKKLRERFINFSNAFWFPELSNQDQGIEMFQHMIKAFEIPKMYDEVEKEIQRTIDHMELNYQESFNKVAMWFTIIALFFAFFEISANERYVPEESLFGTWIDNAARAILFLAAGVVAYYFISIIGIKKIWKRIYEFFNKP